jgi:hypothetical protein
MIPMFSPLATAEWLRLPQRDQNLGGPRYLRPEGLRFPHRTVEQSLVLCHPGRKNAYSWTGTN